MRLTPNQKRAIRHLWKGELTLGEIAEELGLTLQQLDEIALRLDLPDRPDSNVFLPSREEILLAAAAIRAGWTQAEREARLVGGWRCTMDVATGVDTNAGRSAARDRADGGPADGASR